MSGLLYTEPVLGILDMETDSSPMSFEEKNTWVFMLTSLCGALVYAGVVLARSQGVSLLEVAYVGPMLSTIGAATLVGLVGKIVISMSNPKEAAQKDQRDRQIDDFGTIIGQSFLAIGGIAALILSMLEVKHFWISQTLYAGFVLSAVLGSAAKLMAYREGLPQ